MRLFELFESSESNKKKEKTAPKPRNFVHKNMIQTGAGPMKDKKKAIPRKEKHKNKPDY